MEINRRAAGEVKLPIAADADNVDIKLKVDTEIALRTVEFDVGSDNVATVIVPANLTVNSLGFTLFTTFVLNGEEVSYVDYVDIISPLVSDLVLLSILPNETVEKRQNYERMARKLIEAYTGQVFDYYKYSYEVVSLDGAQLILPAKLDSLTGITANGYEYDISSLSLYSSGWKIQFASGQFLNIKEAPPEDLLDNWNGGAIYVPSSYRKFGGSTYSITGMWGYRKIPDAIRLAAEILVTEISCDESLYRDRYLTAVRRDNFRIDYDKDAFEGTGNARADLLLSPFREMRLLSV